MKHWSEADKITQDEIESYKPVYHYESSLDWSAPNLTPNEEILEFLSMEGNPLSSEKYQEYIRKHNIGHTSFSSGDLIYWYETDQLFVLADGGFKELPKELRNTHMEAVRMTRQSYRNEIAGNAYANDRINNPEDY